METQAVELKQSLAAPRSHVYRAFTNAMALREWLSNTATVQPHPGGRFYLAWDHGYYTSGEYVIVEPENMVEFTWRGRGEPGETKVQVRLESRADSTELTLTHAGLGEGDTWQILADKFRRDWNNNFENLASVLETGQDLRITRRPLLGIYPGELTVEQAKRLGVPVNVGVRLDGVLDGMGAQKAGLQKDDVIVEVDGLPVKPGQDIYQILSQHRAGDVLEVSYYRGPEKRATQMTLSARRIPELPKTREGLAEALTMKYAEVFSALEATFKGVTDEQASHCAAPGEWNAKHVLAHLIHSERFNLFWITELVFDQERVSDGYTDNLMEQVLATTSVYTTVPALMDELKRNNAETIELIKTLPVEFVSHKGAFWKLAYSISEFPDHITSHLEQIKNAIGINQ